VCSVCAPEPKYGPGRRADGADQAAHDRPVSGQCAASAGTCKRLTLGETALISCGPGYRTLPSRVAGAGVRGGAAADDGSPLVGDPGRFVATVRPADQPAERLRRQRHEAPVGGDRGGVQAIWCRAPDLVFRRPAPAFGNRTPGQGRRSASGKPSLSRCRSGCPPGVTRRARRQPRRTATVRHCRTGVEHLDRLTYLPN
jgi:hypothetical protein